MSQSLETRIRLLVAIGGEKRYISGWVIMRRLTDDELKILQAKRAEGKASFACEGIVLTAEEDALFEQFDAERLPPDQRRARLMDYCRRKQALKVRAAE